MPDDFVRFGFPRDATRLFARVQKNEPLGRAATEFAARFDASLPSIGAEVASADGSTRLAIGEVEAVHMPRPNGRVTVCLSSQVGCAMGCGFCATAKMGLVRNLSAAEIVAQLIGVLRRFETPASMVNLVFMGMGEPLHNIDELCRALDVICHPAGLSIAPSRITVSTSGHVSGLEKLGRSRSIDQLPELAISVNAMRTEQRRGLMPIEKKWSLADLRAALDAWPRRPHSKVTIEYVLLRGVNDDLESAALLAGWVRPPREIVNVIPFNAWDGSDFREPDEETLQAFVDRLRAEGCLVKVRRSRGRDARGACGTLSTRTEASLVRPKNRISEKSEPELLRTV